MTKDRAIDFIAVNINDDLRENDMDLVSFLEAIGHPDPHNEKNFLRTHLKCAVIKALEEYKCA